MVRRHTTGTGLYLAAQQGKLSKHHHRPGSVSDSSDEFDSDDEASLSDSSSSSDGGRGTRTATASSTRLAARGAAGEHAVGAGGEGGHIRRVKSGVRKKDVFGDPWGQRVW